VSCVVLPPSPWKNITSQLQGENYYSSATVKCLTFFFFLLFFTCHGLGTLIRLRYYTSSTCECSACPSRDNRRQCGQATILPAASNRRFQKKRCRVVVVSTYLVRNADCPVFFLHPKGTKTRNAVCTLNAFPPILHVSQFLIFTTDTTPLLAVKLLFTERKA
jgi:hypothetical protein